MNWLHGLFGIGILIGVVCFLWLLFLVIELCIEKSENWSNRTTGIIIGAAMAAIVFLIGSIN